MLRLPMYGFLLFEEAAALFQGRFWCTSIQEFADALTRFDMVKLRYRRTKHLTKGNIMEKLITVSRSENSCIYRIDGEFAPGVQRYIVTHPESRAALNRPEITGHRFTSMLVDSLTYALSVLPEKEFFQSVPEENINVLTFLRGGLNFNLREALHRAWGLNRHSSSFMTSQRSRDDYGRWYIEQDQYRKMILRPGSMIFAGDIIATGVTVDNGLDILMRNCKNLGKPVKGMVFFTIGCHKLEKIMARYHEEFKKIFPGYRHTIAIYLEGKFHLADSRTGVKIKMQGTDLMRFPALQAPEMLRDSFKRIHSPLERCVIYDGGSRSFDVASYLREIIEYWEQVEQLADAGVSLDSYIEDRCPALSFSGGEQEFLKEMQCSIWPDVPQELILSVHKHWQEYHERLKPGNADSPHGLRNFCRERVDLLRHPSRIAELMSE